MKSTITLALAAATVAYAQDAPSRPEDTSICDFYTTALLMENNATNQYTLVQLLVNTAVIGNYTQPNVAAVPGILAPGMVDGEEVNLLPYFTGDLASTNRNGEAVSVNFLDDGGAEPIMMNMAANSENSRQYRLLTHLYTYFSFLLGCSEYGVGDFPKYTGSNNMYKVHEKMGLSNAEVTYFIQQVGLSAASFGVAEDDIKAVGTALTDAFGYRCSPPAAIPANTTEELQSICIADDCPIAPEGAVCDQYDAVVQPQMAGNATAGGNSTMGGGNGTTTGGSGSGSGGDDASQTDGASPPMQTGAASNVGAMFGSVAVAMLGAVVAFV